MGSPQQKSSRLGDKFSIKTLKGTRVNIRKIGLVGRTYRHVERYLEILGVLFRFGFDDLVSGLKVEQYLDFGRRIFFQKDEEKVATLSRAHRLRMALEELGPTFIKLGQVLSTRRDLLPGDFIEELSRLQDKVPSFPYEEVERILSSELKESLNETFRDIHREPLAAASIGQVHRAVLVDGEEAVIKVQRPRIGRTVEVDLEILFHLATLMEKHMEGWDVQRPTEVVEHFGRTMERELDYTIEAASMERFAGLFLKEARVYVPKVHREATTSRILTMEYIDGIKSDSLQRLQEKGYDLREIADRGADLLMQQIFVHGFFHADPHPGNLLILPRNVICFLDMGMMGHLDRGTREDVLDLVMGAVRRDESALVSALLRITLWDEEPERRALEKALREFMDLYLYRPLEEVQLGDLMGHVFEIASRFRLRIPPDILLLIKALTTLENLGSRLDPDFDVIRKAAPFVERMQRERYHPLRLTREVLGYGEEVMHLLKEIPGDFRAVLRMVRQGKLKIEFEHHGLDALLTTQDRTSNRLSFAIVLASLIIGSSLIILADVPPRWHDIPLIGLAGYLVAGVMGFWLLISILRRGRL
ncbi:MAG: AarF/ABC1/UbiB kinase family protein [Deltaproteobacteria bacterium]|nr:AarF/ABC1/UbiB kinase family protein [Deltaproteobacteria bacterium]